MTIDMLRRAAIMFGVREAVVNMIKLRATLMDSTSMPAACSSAVALTSEMDVMLTATLALYSVVLAAWCARGPSAIGRMLSVT